MPQGIFWVYATSKHRQPWATVEVLQACNERRALNLKQYTSQTDGMEYSNCNRRVERTIKLVKEIWINEHCTETRHNMGIKNSKKAFEMVKTLTRKWQQK